MLQCGSIIQEKEGIQSKQGIRRNDGGYTLRTVNAKLAGQTHKISTSTSNNSNQETDSERKQKGKSCYIKRTEPQKAPTLLILLYKLWTWASSLENDGMITNAVFRGYDIFLSFLLLPNNTQRRRATAEISRSDILMRGSFPYETPEFLRMCFKRLLSPPACSFPSARWSAWKETRQG